MSLLPNEVKTENIASGAVTTPKIGDGQVTRNKLQDTSVTTEKIAVGAVTGSKIGEAQIYGSKLRDGAVRSEKIASEAITTSKIGEQQVTGSRIKDNAITTEKIANNAITTSKIVDRSVTPAKLSFTPPSIARPITPPIIAAEIATDAVETAKIKDGAVTVPKLAQDAAPNDGDIFSYNAATGKGKWIPPPAGGGAKIFTGFYLGNGNPTQAITGVGFRPKFVMVWCATTINHGPFIKTDQDGLLTLLHDNQLQFLLDVDAIISLDADGFTVGSSYDINNGAPRTYNFWCLG